MRGKRIGFLLTSSELKEITVVNEIERLLRSGAEVSIVVYDTDLVEKQAAEDLLCWITGNTAGEKALSYGGTNSAPGGNNAAQRNPFFLDLQVIITGNKKIFSVLAKNTGEKAGPIPLLLAPRLNKVSPAVLKDVSMLLHKRGVYFVPFGPVGRASKKNGTPPGLYSRLDLLTEACREALAGNQLSPSTWDVCPIPVNDNIFP